MSQDCGWGFLVNSAKLLDDDLTTDQLEMEDFFYAKDYG